MFLCLVAALPLQAATWYVRPASGEYGAEDGTSYDAAWDGFEDVTWNSVQPGDTVYVCGQHLRVWSAYPWNWEVSPTNGTDEDHRVTVRGDYPEDPGTIWGYATPSSWTEFDDVNHVWSWGLRASTSSSVIADITESNTWTSMSLVESLEDCQLTPGTYYATEWTKNGTLYVHLADEGDPTGRVYINQMGYRPYLYGRQYITWKNLKFYYCYRWAELSNDPTPEEAPRYITWDGCYIRGCYPYWGNYAHHLTWTGCEICYQGMGGIYAIEWPRDGRGHGPSHFTITGCRIHDISGTKDSHAIGAQGVSNFLIEKNEFYNCGSGPNINMQTAENGPNTNVIIRWNYIHDMHTDYEANGEGIKFGALWAASQAVWTGCQVYGNVISGCTDGINIGWGCVEVPVYNNTVYNCGTNFKFLHSLTPVIRFKNNISLSPTTYHLYYNSGESEPNVSSDYNCFYPIAGNQFFRNWPGISAGACSWATWQGSSEEGCDFDPHSKTDDPLLVSAETGFLSLTSDSPAIDTGADVGLTEDRDGNPIPQGLAPDIGSYEYVGTPTTYALSVTVANGSVTKSPDKSAYESGEIVTLQAVANSGYAFTSWSGDLTGSENPATVVMDRNKSVTANFAANVYTLSVTASGGSVSRSPNQASYEYGTEVTLQATADAGYTFSGWSGDASGTNNPATVIMNADRSVTANFTANAYTLAVAATNGAVVAVPQKASYSYGETVSLQAVASTGYHFAGWSGDLSGSANPSSIVMNANKSVTAGFAINTYTLNATAVNGSVAKSPDRASYNYGETVSLQAVAAAGYEFAGWSGALSGTTNPASLLMDSNKSVTATFTALSSDQDAPVLYGSSPAADAIQAPLNSLVQLHISDAGEGVDANTVRIAVNGESVYVGNVASYTGSSGVCRRVGAKADYTYAYQATEDFDYDATVTVVVNAADLAGNAMSQQSYSFRTQMRAFGANRCVTWGPADLDKGAPATVRDASGNVWVVYHAGDSGARDIYVSRWTSGMEQFGMPVRVTTDAADQCNPDVALGTDGRLYVVWQDNRRGNWDVYASTSADGVTWSSAVRVAESDYDETSPAITVDARMPNYAYVAWQDNRSGNQDIYVSISSSGFAAKTVQAVTSNAQNQIAPRIAVNASNTVYIVWTDYRNGSADVYGAASNGGPWSNVPVVTGTGNQSSPVIAAEPSGDGLHFAWVSDLAGNDDICYGLSYGLPASPLSGINIIDDSLGARQWVPAIVVAGGAGDPRIFVCWQDARNATDGWDMDIYAVEIKAGGETNLLVGDGGSRMNQSEPAIGVDRNGRPYVVWTDDRNATNEVYFAASTFVEPTPLDERLVGSAAGGTVGVASPATAGDVSVVIPAGACPYDVTISVARIQDLQPSSFVEVLPYEFGPSGLQFDAPVTITIAYWIADYGSNPPQPYWYDSLTGTLTQQGITNIQYVALSSTTQALRFQTTHFTPYTLVAAAGDDDGDGTDDVPAGGSGGGGGGCALSPVTGESGVVEFFVPCTLLAVVMISIRLRDRRTRRCLSRPEQGNGP